MPRQLTDTLTKLEYRPLVDALRRVPPTMPSSGIVLLAAHVALETGMRWCHCWNLGNVKYTGAGNHDWCMFACGEEVTLSQALALRTKDPGLVEFRGNVYLRNGREYQSIWLKPPHPWTRFRAFESLGEGVLDYIETLRSGKFKAAWELLPQGLATPYANALAKAGYFTAGVQTYAKTLRNCQLDVRGNLIGKPTLKRHQQNDEAAVKEWQERVLGFVGDDVDGDFGGMTESATKRWQEQRGLLNDGWVGPRSWATAFPAVEVVS